MPSKPPSIQTPATLPLPAHKEITLTNGVTLIAVEDTSQPILTMSIVSRSGAADEDVWGETNFMASLMNKGTELGVQKRDAQTLAEEIDFTGGSLSVSCVFDSLSAHLSILSDFTDTGLDLLTDVVNNPSFPPEEIERTRQQTLVEIEQANNDAAYLSSIAFTQGMFRGEKYGHPVVGTLETVAELQQTDCQRAYSRSLNAENLFIAAAGNFNAEELAEKITKHGLRSREISQPYFSASLEQSQDLQATQQREAQQREAKVVLIEKPDAAQTSLRMGFRTANRGEADFIPMQFLNTIFGGSFISRLNHNLREEKGYTYGIQSSIDARKHSSVLTISSHVGSETVDSAVSEILREMERLRTEPITDDELETTRKYMIGSFALRTETPTQVVSMLSTLELYGLPKDYHTRYLTELAAMTKERLFEVQQRRFNAEGIVIAASGNIEHLQQKLRNFGAVSVVTPSGAFL
jgi:predicted Zn-dependent peptidase